MGSLQDYMVIKVQTFVFFDVRVVFFSWNQQISNHPKSCNGLWYDWEIQPDIAK